MTQGTPSWLVIAVFLVVGLAGCAKDKPVTEADSEAYDPFGDLEAGAGQGVIRGVVVDPSIVPIRGASIELQGESKSVETGKDGTFGFGNLTVGTYFLRISKLGYFEATQQVTVEPDNLEPAVTKITLQPDASTLPYVLPDQYTGFVSCSLGGVPACRVASFTGAFDDRTSTTMPLDRDPLHLQSQMSWVSNQDVSDELWLWHAYGDDAQGTGLGQGILGQIQGENPLVLVTTPETAAANGEAEGYAGLGIDHDLNIAVFGGSIPETRLFCDAGYCGGVGLTFEQDFNVYSHAFYRFTPPEGWLFTRDGIPRP